MVNAFWLDREVEQAVRWLADLHVTSSVFECAMVLTTAVQLNGYEGSEELYFSHREHPLTRWAAASHENWQRLYAYTEAAHEEWRYRWDHAPSEYHGSWEVVCSLDLTTVEYLDWPTASADDPPQITGEWCAPDYVVAYRLYYANEKRHLFAWAKERAAPPWLEAHTFDV